MNGGPRVYQFGYLTEGTFLFKMIGKFLEIVAAILHEREMENP